MGKLLGAAKHKKCNISVPVVFMKIYYGIKLKNIRARVVSFILFLHLFLVGSKGTEIIFHTMYLFGVGAGDIARVFGMFP